MTPKEPPPLWQPMRADWTVGIDDAMCERFPVCLVCGQQAQRMDLWAVGPLTLAVSRCRHCAAQDPQGEALRARLRQRQGAGGP
jgi:hypothetical protein